MSDPDSVDEWLALADQHMHTARALQGNRLVGAQAVFHVGVGIECALKALIMHRERLNGWPSRSSRRELYTHDLRDLGRIAGVRIDAADPVAAAWHVVLQWDRGQGYDPRPMPPKVARSYVEAAFGPNGVADWIRSAMNRL